MMGIAQGVAAEHWHLKAFCQVGIAMTSSHCADHWHTLIVPAVSAGKGDGLRDAHAND